MIYLLFSEPVSVIGRIRLGFDFLSMNRLLTQLHDILEIIIPVRGFCFIIVLPNWGSYNFKMAMSFHAERFKKGVPD